VVIWYQGSERVESKREHRDEGAREILVEQVEYTIHVHSGQSKSRVKEGWPAICAVM